MTCNDDDDTSPLPSADALLAGTLALMTAWADPCPNCQMTLPAQRALLARKVVSNLFFLQHHPQVGSSLRQVLLQTHRRWVPLAQPVDGSHPALVSQPDAALH